MMAGLAGHVWSFDELFRQFWEGKPVPHAKDNYANRIYRDDLGLHLAVSTEHAASIRAMLSESSIVHSVQVAGSETTSIDFGSDVSIDDIQTTLERWAELEGEV